MLEALKRLISPEYLVVAEPGPMGGLWVLYLGLGLLFGAGLVVALWVLLRPACRSRLPGIWRSLAFWAKRDGENGSLAIPFEQESKALRAWAWFTLWVCLAGLGTVVGRFLGWPGWSARIWPYLLAAMTVAGALAYGLRRLRLPRWLAIQLAILGLVPAGDGHDQPAEPPVSVQDGYEPYVTANEVKHCHEYSRWQSPGGQPEIASPQKAAARNDFSHNLSGTVGHGETRNDVHQDDPEEALGAPERRGRRLFWYLALLALHLAGIGLLLVARLGWPVWAAPLVLGGLLLPQAPLLRRRQAPRLMVLAPLLGAYAVTLLWLAYAGLEITVIGWQGLVFPNPMVSLFYVDGILLAAVTYALLCGFYVTSKELGRWELLWRAAVAGLLVATLIWAGIVYFGKRTRGATASDPYAYAQMGVDLAETGSFMHRYTLFQEVIPLEIAWAPLQPVGYHIPRNDLGDCPSVWATGASVLLAGGYLLLGETGLYVTTPAVALLALAATWALVQEALRGKSRAIRYTTGALAVALLATSPEHVDRLLVPMADAPAQLFTVLMLVFVLRGMRQFEEGRRGLWSFLFAGISFAWAYWVRHTQLVLALPAILAVSLGYRAWIKGSGGQARRASVSRRVSAILLPLGVFFAAALLAAVPDIFYRWRVFGGPLATETTELPLMGLQHIAPVAWQMLRDSLAAGEWGYLFPLALYGGYRLGRERRPQALILGSAFLAVLLVHLTYHSLRLRDLISLFPLLDLAVAYGAVTLVRLGWRITSGPRQRLGSALLPAAVVAWLILSLALARWAMIDNLWKPGWASFGYMRAEHRAAFDRLAELTPPEAIIGASLNAGAVMMYTGRDAIRPYDSWTAEEWTIFLEAMEASGRPVYLLDDGGLMADYIAAEQERHRLTPIGELQVPLFNTRDRETGWLYRLEWNE